MHVTKDSSPKTRHSFVVGTTVKNKAFQQLAPTSTLEYLAGQSIHLYQILLIIFVFSKKLNIAQFSTSASGVLFEVL